ncbi:MAG: hypothetical protein WC759_02250 [Candidatus Micrarchaeia archaeon]|jgi:formylmethanofuran dehydrogenase subunit E
MAEQCIRCGTQIESWDGNYFSRGMLCPNCYSESARRADEKSAICTRCGLRIAPKDANLKLGRTLCQKCYEEEVKFQKEHFCARCGTKIEGASFEKPEGTRLCLQCMRDQSPGGGRKGYGIRVCDRCGKEAMIRMVTADGENVCLECSQKQRQHSIVGRFMDALRPHK